MAQRVRRTVELYSQGSPGGGMEREVAKHVVAPKKRKKAKVRAAKESRRRNR